MAKEAKTNGVAQPVVAPEVKQPTEAELMAELKAALAKNDFKAVATISRKIDGITKAKEKAELEAKRAALAKVEEIVKAAIAKAVKPLIDSKQLDAADGIWFSYDFGEAAPTVRLTRTAAKAPRAGGGGTGKKFDISTDQLLAKHGAEKFNDEMTYQQAYESNTDKNFRYAIRTKLLKLEGVL
jgi:hypothetical protein